MAQIRTLKLNLLADVTKFGAGMVDARGDINKLSTTATRAGQAVKAAFIGMGVAAGYAAVRIGKDAVEAAIEDEASQKTLAQSLRNTVKATDETIASTEKWITAQQFATGFSDSQLRPALAKLTTVTKSVAEAQNLTNLAMNISRGTGKDLESVTLALVKAHEGNLGALTRLGVPLDEATKKTGDFNQATKVLWATYGGQASTYAETYAGKMEILNQKFSEFKEGIGADLIGRFSGLLTVVNDVARGFSGDDPNAGLSGAVQKANRALGIDTKSGGYNLGESLKTLTTSFEKLWTALTSTQSNESITTLDSIANSLEKVASAIDTVSTAYTKGKKALDWLEYDSWAARALGFVTNRAPQRAAGGSISGNQVYRVGEFGSEMFVPAGVNGSIRKDTGGSGNTFILNGIVDAESARRSIEKLLQDSARRTGAVSLTGATL